MALMVMMLADNVEKPFDKLKALKISLVHDLPEVICGDIPYSEVLSGKVCKNEKTKNEKEGLEKLCSMLPEKYAEEIRGLWHECEKCTSKETKFVNVIDKVECAFHSVYMGADSWVMKDAFVMHTNKVCGLMPEGDDLIKYAKLKLQEECDLHDIPWKEEYNGF